MKRTRFLGLAAFFALLLAACHPVEPDPIPDKTYERNGESGITYQLLVYSFADSNGDGIGDFKGIENHLSYLKDMGVTALWLSPIHPASSYHGYNVSDYYSVNPEYGTEADFKSLVDAAAKKGIDIYIDYVLNHSGSDNEWFKQACADPNSKYRNYYVISDNPSADVAAGRIDNYAGATSPGMGSWYSISNASGRMHFVLDWNKKTVTVTRTDDPVSSSDANATKWLYYGDGTMVGFHETSSGIFEVTVDFSSSWGFLIRTSKTSWDGGTKWGGNGTALTLGKAYTINNSSAQDITFNGGSWYFASFDKSMPDLNYGPYATASQSAAFKDLAASADKWINMGVNGLRLDAVLWIYQNQTTANVSFLKQWYDHCNATYKARGGKGEFYMVSEAWADNVDAMAPYYQGTPSNFNFYYWYTLKDRINRGMGGDFASTIRSFRNLFQAKRSDFIDAIKLSNHDEDRAGNDLGKDAAKEKLAAAVLLTSPGKPYVYQGEELGYWGTKSNGDEYVRSPMMWKADGSGLASAKLNGKVDKSMLTSSISVESQEKDAGSVLNVYRTFGVLRDTYEALSKGTFEPLQTVGSLSAWYRTYNDQKVLVIHNFTNGQVSFTATEELSKLIGSNGTVNFSGKKVDLSAYASAVFLL